MGAACEDTSGGGYAPPGVPASRTPVKLMQPSCGDVGTFVVFSLTASQETIELGDKATFAGGGEVKGTSTYNDADDRWTLSVNVPPGAVTGPVLISKKDSGGSYDFGVFTVGCPGPPDAGTPDSGSIADAPPAGFVKVLTSNVGVSAEGKLGISAADSNAETAADDYALAALSLAPGTCSQGPWDPPDGPTPEPEGGDVGTSVEVKDGTTTIAKLGRQVNGGLYIGSGSTPAFGKKLDLSVPGGAVTVTPSLVPGFVQTISSPLTITEPASPSAVLTQGQPFTFKWNAFDADTFIVTFPGNPSVCRLDPKAGQFVVPGATTQLLAAGQFQQALLFALTRRSVNVKIGGEDRSIRGYSEMIRPATYTVQP